MEIEKTKECPHCHEQIKEEAKKCRFCGEWLEKNNNAPLTTQSINEVNNPQNKSSKGKKSGIGCLMILVVIIIIIIANSGSDKGSKISSSNDNAVKTQSSNQAVKEDPAQKQAREEAQKKEEEEQKAKEAEEQKVWEKTKAGQICLKHSEWKKTDCEKIADKQYWIGMSYDMLVELGGKPNSANPSNYGNGTQWQWCWHNKTPSCFYGDDDGIIDSYN